MPKRVVLTADAESDEGLLKDVEFYALDSRQESILWDVQPVFVVVYDPDITFVRQLEVWRDWSLMLSVPPADLVLASVLVEGQTGHTSQLRQVLYKTSARRLHFLN